MPEHDGVGAVAEARPQPHEAAAARAGVVEHRHARPARLHHPLRRQQPAQLGRVHVAMDRRHGRTDRLELAKRVEGVQIAGVEQQIRRLDPLHARVRQAPGPARQMGVRDHGDQHVRTRLAPSRRP